jgi:ketosteroid isomerase-like protein
MPKVLTLALMTCLFLPTDTAAQSAEEQVEQQVLSFYQALNDGDARAWASHNNTAQYHGNFPRQGTLFATNQPIVENMQQGFDSGSTSYNLVVHHIDVSTYGNTAVATFYTTGPTTLADGTVITGTFRVTQVWIRDGQSWHVVHFHISPLAS